MTTYERLTGILAHEYNLPRDKLQPDSQLEELGIDSLGVMELLFKIEDEFHISVPADQVELRSIGDVADYIERLEMQQAGSSPVQEASASPQHRVP